MLSVLFFSQEGRAYVRVFRHFHSEKMKETLGKKKKLMQTTLSFVSFMFFSSVRSNMSTWYLRSCLQFCDNVYSILELDTEIFFSLAYRTIYI